MEFNKFYINGNLFSTNTKFTIKLLSLTPWHTPLIGSVFHQHFQWRPSGAFIVNFVNKIQKLTQFKPIIHFNKHKNVNVFRSYKNEILAWNLFFIIVVLYLSLIKQYQVSISKKMLHRMKFLSHMPLKFFCCPKCILNILIHADILMHADTPPVAAFLKSRILALCQDLLLGFY